MSRYQALFLAVMAFAAPLRAAEPAAGADYAPPDPTEAPIVLLHDMSSGQTLFAREADRRFLPASITKVMTTLLAFDMLKAGRITEDQKYIVRPEVARAWSGKGTGLFLRAGQQITVAELLRGITTASANDASIVLAEGAAGSTASWVTLMNRRAHELEMVNSHFGTPNGWPDAGQTYVTAQDMVRLAQALIERHMLFYRQYIGRRSVTVNGVALRNHDPISGVVAGADGIKTGHTREAGYTFLGSAEREGRRLIMVIAAAPSESARAHAARGLIEWGFSAFDSRPLFAGDAIIGQAKVQGGARTGVPLRAGRELFVAVPKDGRRDIHMSLRYKGPIKAPIDAGDKVAELEIRVEGMPAYRVPLYAERAVESAGPFRRIWNGLKGIFA